MSDRILKRNGSYPGRGKPKFKGCIKMAKKVTLKEGRVKVKVDSETALEMLLDLTSLDTFLEAESCGRDCLSMRFKRGDRIDEHQIRGLHPRLVEKFSQDFHFI